MNTRPARRRPGGLILATVVISTSIGTGAAMAAPSSNNGRHVGQNASVAPSPHGATVRNAHANANASAHASAKAAKAAQKAAHKAAHKAAQQQEAQQQAAHTAVPQAAAASADPPGNNGTVKIAGVGDLDRIPNNTAHPGCSFEVQWYGFDGGADVVSTVSFTPWAPTGDVSISVAGPTQVPVGQDAASGAGTPTGLDAVQTYTLSFSGGAPAKQGYHVRLTVATPRSLGNDTKTKMFWVEPCASAAPAAAADTLASGAAPKAMVVAPVTAAERVSATGRGVPTAIEAGQRHSLAARLATSPWAWLLVALGLGAMTAGAAFGVRRRV